MQITNLEQEDRIKILEDFKKSFLTTIFPVGSIYMSFDENFNPNDVYGGTWKRIQGYTLVGATQPDEETLTGNDKLQINSSQVIGEVNHTLTVDEMPSHRHMLNIKTAGSTENEKYQWGVNTTQQDNMGDNFTSYEGRGLAHNNIQPSIGVMMWYKVSDSQG